jgi:VanZ family protein
MALRRFLALVAWAGVIFALSSISEAPEPTTQEWPSVVAHLVEYAVFGLLAAWFLRAVRPAGAPGVLAAAAWALSVAYGISDEWHQSFVPHRTATVFDLVVDAIGAAFGVGVEWWLARRRVRVTEAG